MGLLSFLGLFDLGGKVKDKWKSGKHCGAQPPPCTWLHSLLLEATRKMGKHMNGPFTHIKSSSMQTVSKFIHCGEMQFKAIPIYHVPPNKN